MCTTRITLYPNQMAALRHRGVAEEHAECSICFDPLYCRQCVILVTPTPSGVQRVCMHAFHTDCIERLSTKSCPICRTKFTEVITVANPLISIIVEMR